MKKPLITLSSDFAIGSHGCAIMEAIVYQICPEAKIIHFEHGIPDFDVLTAARVMETVKDLPVGFHVCVVDPCVGTKRRGIIIKTDRGDHLIGPDNGVLIPASRILGGIEKSVEITNQKYMRKPVSSIFHGRDIFAPAAAYLAKGISIEEFGKEIKKDKLAKAPYEEAAINNGRIDAAIISINKFGSVHLNIMSKEFDKLKLRKGNDASVKLGENKIIVRYTSTFGDVEKGKPLIMKDDYGRIQVSVNQGSLAKKYNLKVGDAVLISK